MRYLTIPLLSLALFLPAACKLPDGRAGGGESGAGGSASTAQDTTGGDPLGGGGPPPVRPVISGSGTVDIATLSDVLPNETHGRVGNSGLHRPANTVASLGDPAQPGMWLETPLVQATGAGRVRLASGGGEIDVTLIPVPGPVTAGSRLSLAAMRKLGVPLGDLVTLSVSSVR